MRLRRKYSMTRHAEFDQARKQGIAKSGRFLVVSTISNKELHRHKAGIIITKKIGNAVTRNRLRRRIHNILAKHIDEIDTTQGKRYLVTILRWRAPQASSHELEQDWLNQASKLGLLKATHI
ncbi:MAG: ribonuclease P protein component [Akkermansiaceae bacterium]|nr:ribonuclease P protein component [Akkermansiaceae bacterium]